MHFFRRILQIIQKPFRRKRSIQFSKKQKEYAMPQNAHVLCPPSIKDHKIQFLAPGEKTIEKFSLKQFEQITRLQYLQQLEFKDQKTFKEVQTQCLKALNSSLIDEEHQWLGIFHAEQIQQNYIANVSIRWINEEIGYGLFAENHIKAWEFLGEYTGVVRKRNHFFRNINDYCFSYPTSVLYFKKHTIDAENKGNEMRYANHSDIPNSESISVLHNGILHVIIRAIKDIPLGQQITYDYTDIYWQSRIKIPNP